MGSSQGLKLSAGIKLSTEPRGQGLGLDFDELDPNLGLEQLVRGCKLKLSEPIARRHDRVVKLLGNQTLLVKLELGRYLVLKTELPRLLDQQLLVDEPFKGSTLDLLLTDKSINVPGERGE